MAGTNQASNLSGLFAGFDTKLQDPTMFNRGIENTFRPDFGTSEKGMLEAAAWEAKMGRAAESKALTAAAQQKQLARVEAAETATLQADADYASTVGNVNRQFEMAAQTGDRGMLERANAARAMIPLPVNETQSRAYNNIKPADYGQRVETKQSQFVTQKLTNAHDALDAEMAKPVEKQNPAAIRALNNVIQDAELQHPEAAKEWSSLQKNKIELREQQRAANEQQQLGNAQKEMQTMLADDVPVDEIRERLAQNPNYTIDMLADSFEVLEKYQANAAKIKAREGEASVVTELPNDLKQMVEEIPNADPALKAQLNKEIDFLMKDRDMHPHVAVRRATEFAQRLSQYELGVARDAHSATATENARYRTMVNQVRLQPTSQDDMDAAYFAMEAGLEAAKSITNPASYLRDVDYGQMKALADGMRMARAGLGEFTPYVFDQYGNPQFDKESGQPLMKDNFEHKSTFDVSAPAAPGATQRNYRPPVVDTTTQAGRRANQQNTVNSNQPPPQPTTLDAVEDVLGSLPR